jgi:hypothetical protein
MSRSVLFTEPEEVYPPIVPMPRSGNTVSMERLAGEWRFGGIDRDKTVDASGFLGLACLHHASGAVGMSDCPKRFPQFECSTMRISRRDFVKSATASGIALSITPLAVAEEPSFAARETLPGRQGWNPAATGVGRIDGVLSCAVITDNPEGTSYTSPTCMVAARASTANRSARWKATRWGSHLPIGRIRSRSMTKSGACSEALGSTATSGVRGQCAADARRTCGG